MWRSITKSQSWNKHNFIFKIKLFYKIIFTSALLTTTTDLKTFAVSSCAI
uniref:Uncharacterized protein n=1 Tax=Ciona intestinalis TaxID=7719 RepID=F6TPU2_CIOIN